jgi:hypothetical protein
MADNKDFLTDEEMAQHESSSSPDFLSDDDMQKHEATSEQEATAETPDFFSMPTLNDPREAGLRAFAKNATLGFAPKIGAAAGALGTLSEAGVDPKLGLFGSLKKNYEEALPEVRSQTAAQDVVDERNSPWLKAMGGLAGTGAALAAATSAMPLLGGGAASGTAALVPEIGAGLGQRLALSTLKHGLIGAEQIPAMAAYGAVHGAGRTEDLTNIPDLAKNVATDAAENAAMSPVGGATIGALGELAPAAYGAVKPLLNPLVNAGKGVLELPGRIPFVKGLGKRFALNLPEGATTSGSDANKLATSEALITAGKEATVPLEKYHTKLIEESAAKITDIANRISSITAEGASNENQNIIKQQLAQAKAMFADLVNAGEEAGKGIGEMMKGAKGSTKALKDSFTALETSVKENPWLSQDEEAKAFISQYKQAISEAGKEVTLPSSIISKFGEEEKTVLKDAFKDAKNLSPEDVDYLKEVIKLPQDQRMEALSKRFSQVENKVVSGKATKLARPIEDTTDEREFLEGSLKHAEENTPELVPSLQKDLNNFRPDEVTQTQVNSEIKASNPSVLKESASAPEYLNALKAIDDKIQKVGSDSQLGRTLSENRKKLVSQARTELLGEAKGTAEELATKYGAFKDIINNSNLGNKKELANSLLKEMSSIVEQPDTAVQLNKFNTLIGTVEKLDPSLARKLTEEFTVLNQAKSNIPKVTNPEQVASFLQNELPVVAENAPGDIAKKKIFNPLERYAGKEQASQLEQEATTAAKARLESIEKRKLSDITTVLQNLGNMKNMDPKTFSYFQDLEKALKEMDKAQGTEVAHKFFTENAPLIERFKVMAEDANRTGFNKILQGGNALAALAGKITGNVSRALAKPITQASSAVSSKFPKLVQAQDEYIRKGLKSVPKVINELQSSDPIVRASSAFTASQIPSLRKLTKEDEK